MERTGNISPQDVDAQKVLEESKIFEKALRESEERLRLAQQVARVGTFEWNIKSGVNRWTPELEIMYGLSPEAFPGTQAAWEKLVHPKTARRYCVPLARPWRTVPSRKSGVLFGRMAPCVGC